MNRLQKKCFVLSALVHSALLVLLVFSAAFSSRQLEGNDLPILELIPGKIIDEALAGGGNPAATPQSTLQPPQATPQPPKPQPKEPNAEPPQPKLAPQPPPIETKPPPKPEEKVFPDREDSSTRAAETPKSPKKKPDPVDEFTPVDPTAMRKAQAKEREMEAQRARTQAQQAWRNKLSGSLSNLRGGLSGSTTIEPVGPGGAAYASYSQVVKSIYTHAWQTPDDLNDESLNVLVQVSIAKDGNVVDSSVITPSGNASLDKSVRAVLERVTFVAAFPPGAKEDRRTFKLKFNLKVKQDRG